MFKRRSGLGGLRISVGPMRREDSATGAGAGGAADNGGAPATPPAPPATPPAVPAVPPVDVTQTKEYKEALAKATADAEAKVRAGTKANAQKEIFETLAAALGQKPAEINVETIGKELADARAENARLNQQIAVGVAARKAGGDEDMVTAWLAHKGLLKTLDPAAANFGSEVERIVTQAIKDNPKLAAAAGTPAPLVPGASGPGSTGMGNGSNEGGRVLGLGNALAAAQRR